MSGFRLTSWPAAAGDGAALDRLRGGPRHLPAALARAWSDGLAGWDAPPAARAALDTLRDPDARVVVTGQQPGPWGGPLYCLYKAATALDLAARLRADGRPAVAVFWIGADDADWDEVGWGALPGDDLALVRARWASPLPPRSWVGDARLDVPADAAALLDSGDDPGSPAPGRDRDLADGFAASLLRVFGGDGLLPLDARWDAVRAAGEGLWHGYLDRHAALAAAVRARGAELAAGGAIPAIAGDDADRGLFVIRDRRRADVDPDAWEREARAALAERGPAALAPSVLLRAPLQDHLLGTAVQVVGGGEAAYLNQLGAVYAALGIPEPVRYPRASATLVPGDLVPADRAAEACADPEAWVGALAADRVPAEVRRALHALRRDAGAGLDAVREGGRAFAKDLDQVAASAARKIDHELARLDDVLSRRARQALYAEDPRWRNLPEFLRPRRGPQERGLSAWALRRRAGDRTRDLLAALAARHGDRVAEGAVHHFALEIIHG